MFRRSLRLLKKSTTFIYKDPEILEVQKTLINRKNVEKIPKPSETIDNQSNLEKLTEHRKRLNREEQRMHDIENLIREIKYLKSLNSLPEDYL